MKVTCTPVHRAGLFFMVNTYYCDVRWVSVTDDFGNLVRIDRGAANASLKS